MDWFQSVDIYCERIDAGFWSEPVNALSNLAFVAAAIWAGAGARKRGESWKLVWLLIALAALIGIGSFLFHTYANGWSELADTAPIWSFVALYIYTSIWRLAGKQPGMLAAVGLAALPVLTLYFLALGEGGDHGHHHPGLLNGSEQYAPALIALIVCSVILTRRGHPLRGWMVAATLTFVASLALRTVDPLVCGALPLGTHFGWHILNGLMVGLLLQLLIRAPDRLPPSVQTG